VLVQAGRDGEPEPTGVSVSITTLATTANQNGSGTGNQVTYFCLGVLLLDSRVPSFVR
jgi:hypothetical protein